MPEVGVMHSQQATVAVFPSALGWIGIVGCDGRLLSLVFGETSEAAVWRRFRTSLDIARGESYDWNPSLAARLAAYAEGMWDDFHDVAVDLSHLGPFARRVVRHCRRISPGQTVSYGELAARAGSPGAGRAVGNVMAQNRCPLVVPCHRVIAADGRLGGFSAAGGLRTKQRLLTLEAAASDPPAEKAALVALASA